VARLAQETSIFNQEKLALPEVHHEKDANFDIRIDVPFFPPKKKPEMSRQLSCFQRVNSDFDANCLNFGSVEVEMS